MEWHALVRDDTRREVREYSIVSATQPVPNMYRVWSGAVSNRCPSPARLEDVHQKCPSRIPSPRASLPTRIAAMRIPTRDILACPMHFKPLRGTIDYCDFRNFRDLPWPTRLSIGYLLQRGHVPSAPRGPYCAGMDTLTSEYWSCNLLRRKMVE